MSPTVRNILIIVGGFIIGNIVNMSIILISDYLIPWPGAIDPANMDSLKENLHLLEPKHFIFPFLAHALGTLVAAYVATKYVTSKSIWIGIGMGLVFLGFGYYATTIIPAPQWFNITDLLLAYLPMGWLGWKLGAE